MRIDTYVIKTEDNIEVYCTGHAGIHMTLIQNIVWSSSSPWLSNVLEIRFTRVTN